MHVFHVLYLIQLGLSHNLARRWECHTFQFQHVTSVALQHSLELCLSLPLAALRLGTGCYSHCVHMCKIKIQTCYRDSCSQIMSKTGFCFQLHLCSTSSLSQDFSGCIWNPNLTPGLALWKFCRSPPSGRNRYYFCSSLVTIQWHPYQAQLCYFSWQKQDVLRFYSLHDRVYNWELFCQAKHNRGIDEQL